MMKKIFTVMLLAVAMAMPSQAQVKFGVTAGLNLTNVSTKDVKSNIDNKAGFFAGVTAKFTLPLVGLGVDASALFDQREGKSGDVSIKSQSVQIPINVRYGVGIGSIASVFAFAGPQFGFNVGGDQTITEVANVAKSEWTLKKSNLSLNLGIGATVFSHVQAKINYNIALGKTGEFKMENLVTNKEEILGDAKANAWQVSVAYFF